MEYGKTQWYSLIMASKRWGEQYHDATLKLEEELNKLKNPQPIIGFIQPHSSSPSSIDSITVEDDDEEEEEEMEDMLPVQNPKASKVSKP